MAAGTLPEPGKVVDTINGPAEIGPCLNENCGHRDCDCTRGQAASICPYCGEAIGYETRFYDSDGTLVHADCLEQAIEQDRANRVEKIDHQGLHDLLEDGFPTVTQCDLHQYGKPVVSIEFHKWYGFAWCELWHQHGQTFIIGDETKAKNMTPGRTITVDEVLAIIFEEPA